MWGQKKPVYSQRLNRDLSDLYNHNFSCSSACLSVEPSPIITSITLNLCILEGPYKNGHFSFLLDIPDSYPFKIVEIWSKQPIYHPNIDLVTGRVELPLEWSPVLTLYSLAVALQMMLIEPSLDNILNNEGIISCLFILINIYLTISIYIISYSVFFSLCLLYK